MKWLLVEEDIKAELAAEGKLEKSGINHFQVNGSLFWTTIKADQASQFSCNKSTL